MNGGGGSSGCLLLLLALLVLIALLELLVLILGLGAEHVGAWQFTGTAQITCPPHDVHDLHSYSP